MANKINKKTAYQFGFNGIVITRAFLEMHGMTANKTALFNMSEKEHADLISAAFDNDNNDGCHRDAFFYETANGNFVSAAVDGAIDEDGNWTESCEESGKEFSKFFNLVRV